jgi:hypothetical protein
MREAAAFSLPAVLRPFLQRPAFVRLCEERLAALPPAAVVLPENTRTEVPKAKIVSPPQPVARGEAAVPPSDAEIDAIIDAACNSPNPGQAFRQLLQLMGHWSRGAWAAAAIVSESKISRWIGGQRGLDSYDKSIRDALRQRPCAHWSSVRTVTF